MSPLFDLLAVDHDELKPKILYLISLDQLFDMRMRLPLTCMANIHLLFHAQKYFVIFGALYLAVLLLLTFPYFQSHLLYLNAVKIPLFADFDSPEKYGLAPNRTLNLKITTVDNESIGAWFILSDHYYHSLPTIPTSVAEHVGPALNKYPAVLFLHGNAATRAFSARIQHYQALSSRFTANVLAIDYRGFADSTGKPSEEGLATDAQAAFDWLIANGKKGQDILIVGHSLGTGVAAQLGARLSKKNVKCKGIVLLSPFSSIPDVLDTYNLFGFIPMMKPISLIPGASNFLKNTVLDRFDTHKAVPNITASVLIAHAEDDMDIHHTHSDVLFQAFLDPLLPPVNLSSHPLSLSQKEYDAVVEQRNARLAKRSLIVKTSTINKFGTVEEFIANGRKVILVKTLSGAHDYLGIQEGVTDIIGKTYGLL